MMNNPVNDNKTNLTPVKRKVVHVDISDNENDTIETNKSNNHNNKSQNLENEFSAVIANKVQTNKQNSTVTGKQPLAKTNTNTSNTIINPSSNNSKSNINITSPPSNNVNKNNNNTQGNTNINNNNSSTVGANSIITSSPASKKAKTPRKPRAQAPKPIEEQFPNIWNFVKFQGGEIKIGRSSNWHCRDFIAAYNCGGTVFAGRTSYKSLDATLAALDEGIKYGLRDLYGGEDSDDEDALDDFDDEEDD